MTKIMSSMERTDVKKVGEVWMTPQTLEKHFPKECVVECTPVSLSAEANVKRKDCVVNVPCMKIGANKQKKFPIRFVRKDGIKYEVYARSREEYEAILQRIKDQAQGG